MAEKFSLRAEVSQDMAGMRLDQAAVRLFPDFSRSRLQSWIKEGALMVDARPGKAKNKLFGGEELRLEAELEPQDDWQAEDIDLDIVYADEALLIVNKAAGLVVHPAAGNQHGTLLNALLFRYPELENLPRAGIVHRLDKDTSGLMMVALTLASHRSLVAQLQERSIIREYQAVVVGLITAGGVVDAPIGRHPAVRTRQAIVKGAGGRDAVTHYRVLEKFRSHTHIQLKLETGRTHQIRVHMAHMGYPLVGDQTYGGRLKLPRGASAELIDCLRSYKRQALHAFHLGLQHPQSGEYLEWYAPLPQDMQHLLGILEQDNA